MSNGSERPVDPMSYKLGHRDSQPDDRTLNFAAYAGADIPPPPVAVNWASRVTVPWRMLGNDRAGDCELVSTANLAQTWTANAGREQTIAEADVMGAYSAVSGYNPTTGANDNGCRSLDVLNYWRRSGVGGRKILAFVRLDHHDHREVKTALNLFGGLHCAFQLPRSAAAQFRNRQTWRPAAASSGGSPGSWGGHAVAILSYNTIGLGGPTWARYQRMTWAFWDAYAVEAWAAISYDQIAESGLDPHGFDVARLKTDLAQITRV